MVPGTRKNNAFLLTVTINGDRHREERATVEIHSNHKKAYMNYYERIHTMLVDCGYVPVEAWKMNIEAGKVGNKRK